MEKAGMKVFNLNPGGGLHAFDRMSYDEAIEEASTECSRPIITAGHYDG